MNVDELNQLRAPIEKARDLNIAVKMAQQFPDTDLSQKRFQNYTCSELIALTERLIAQFLDELDGPDARYWPRGYYWETMQQPMQHRHVHTVVQHFASHISSNSWDAVAQYLELLVGFQMQCGFWDRGGRKLHSIPKLRQQGLFVDLETKASQLSTLMEEIRSLKAETSQLASQRQTDAQAVALQLTLVQKQATEVANLVAKSNGDHGQLTQVLGSQKENLEKTNSALGDIEKTKAHLSTVLASAAAKLTASEKRLANMEEKEGFVNEIAGTAAAGLLGQKFEARGRELATSARWWMAGTVLSAVLAGAWLWISHAYIYEKGVDGWTTLALNFGLLLPAIFLVGFFGTQFKKVRHFEEEYAFRSAVAMTLGAFADRLKNVGTQHDALITETVEKLYRLPMLLQEREHGNGWFRQRAVERTLKTAVELLKETRTPLAK